MEVPTEPLLCSPSSVQHMRLAAVSLVYISQSEELHDTYAVRKAEQLAQHNKTVAFWSRTCFILATACNVLSIVASLVSMSDQMLQSCVKEQWPQCKLLQVAALYDLDMMMDHDLVIEAEAAGKHTCKMRACRKCPLETISVASLTTRRANLSRPSLTSRPVTTTSALTSRRGNDCHCGW